MRIVKPVSFVLTVALCSLSTVGFSQESTPLERRSFFQRIFTKDGQQNKPTAGMSDRDHEVFMDRETDTVSKHVDAITDEFVSRQDDPAQRYPEIPGYLTLKNASQDQIEALIEMIYEGYESRIGRMDPPDLRSSRMMAMGSVPNGFPTIWRGTVDQSVWRDQPAATYTLNRIYQSALEHSNQIKVFSDLPLIRETGMQEADGEFDLEMFIDGRLIDRDEPVGSRLTNVPGNNRFREREDFIEGGFRQKFFTGGEATISNRFSTLRNNSANLIPQNQGESQLVLSVVQPVLEGAGYHYNQSKIKLAKFDASMASAEFVRQLQSHLIEVNRAYWALYYSRSYYLISQSLVADTAKILAQLEERSDLDALQSEVLRARASLAMRKAMLNRAEMAIRNSEERLRALVNDPKQDIGSNSEIIPSTPPIISRVSDNVRQVAIDALRNRPEITQGFEELRAAIVRRDMMKNEKLPTLNLVAELMLGDIQPNYRTGSAFNSQFGAGTGHVFGFEFEAPIDNDVARARHLRSELELRQQVNQLRATIDLVLLESVVSYRELMTAFRDMQGRHSALQASREELRQLRERLDVDTEEGGEGGKTVSAQLQLILDSMDRNQSAEELFLDSVVAYNAAFASLDRARGTFLKKENVKIDRVRESDPAHPNSDLEALKVTKAGMSSRGSKSSGGSPSSYNGPADPVDNSVPDVPPVSSTSEEFAPSLVAVPAPKPSVKVKPVKSAPAPPRAAPAPPRAVPAVVPVSAPQPSVKVKPVASSAPSTPRATVARETAASVQNVQSPPVRRVRIGTSPSGAIQSNVEVVPSATPSPN